MGKKRRKRKNRQQYLLDESPSSKSTRNESVVKGLSFSPESNRRPFGSSRKRSLTAIQFYTEESSPGGASPYVFGSTRGSQATTTVTNGVSSPMKAKNDIESIESIFSRRKSDGLTGAETSAKGTAPAAVSESHFKDLHVSGLSVEDALRDKVGCRPRANSTDRELKLPQRGLCDERTVLSYFRWRSTNEISFTGRPRGLNNLGNTCFLNSTLQCLAHLPPFCQAVLLMKRTAGGSGTNTPGKKVSGYLSNTFRMLHDTNKTSSFAPREVVSALKILSGGTRRNGYKFRPGRQEDAHEFLVHLLDTMNDGELREAGINQHESGWRDRLPLPRLDETTFLHRVFGGYLRSQVKCTECGYCSNTYDPFLDLSLEVSQKACHSVASALREYTRQERLDSDNKWKCSGCNKRVRAQKQLTVFRPPLSLCIQLKRFSFSMSPFSYGARGGNKITKPIDFDEEMNLTLSDGRSCAYALTGIVLHVGPSASSGHYTACVKKGAKWFLADDSHVTDIPVKRVLKQRNAYLLFYTRKEVKLEFAAPPVSMSTDQALEVSRARKRARSESFSESMSGENASELSAPQIHARNSSQRLQLPGKRLEQQPSLLREEDGNSPVDESPLGRKLEPQVDADDETQSKPSRTGARSHDSETASSSSTSSSSTSSIESEEEQKPQKPLQFTVDRGPGREKIVVNARKQRSTFWKAPTVVNGRGAEFHLLGNRAIDKWDDETTASSSRRELGQHLEESEQARKRKLHTSRWDAALDAGRTKRVRTKSANDFPAAENGNRFQRIQNSIDRMARRKANRRLHHGLSFSQKHGVQRSRKIRIKRK